MRAHDLKLIYYIGADTNRMVLKIQQNNKFWDLVRNASQLTFSFSSAARHWHDNQALMLSVCVPANMKTESTSCSLALRSCCGCVTHRDQSLVQRETLCPPIADCEKPIKYLSNTRETTVYTTLKKTAHQVLVEHPSSMWGSSLKNASNACTKPSQMTHLDHFEGRFHVLIGLWFRLRVSNTRSLERNDFSNMNNSHTAERIIVRTYSCDTYTWY